MSLPRYRPSIRTSIPFALAGMDCFAVIVFLVRNRMAAYREEADYCLIAARQFEEEAIRQDRMADEVEAQIKQLRERTDGFTRAFPETLDDLEEERIRRREDSTQSRRMAQHMKDKTTTYRSLWW